jgi:hypothetical protein
MVIGVVRPSGIVSLLLAVAPKTRKPSPQALGSAFPQGGGVAYPVRDWTSRRRQH